MKPFVKILVTIVILLLLIGSTIYYLLRPHYFPETKITYVLSPGTNSKTLASDLQKLGIIRYPHLFWLAVRLEGYEIRLKSGEYQFISGQSVQDIISMLVHGRVVRYEITIVDGWTLQQTLEVLGNNLYLQHKLKGMTPAVIAKTLQLTQDNPEGLFLPETYQFTWPDSDQDILRRANKALKVVLQDEWQTRTTGLIYKTPYDALIAASLIQKESGNSAERPKISGVIYRRLVKGMRLQIDPTVIYGLGAQYKGKLTRKDMRFKSPYNTYLHRGLPPTPIALAGADAIYAAMHPDEGTELYFVAKGDGSHQFSSNLKEHDRAILKYLFKKNV